MIDGRGGNGFPRTREMLYTRPDLLLRILEINAQAVAAYLGAQIDAGAQAVMLFDTWGGLLTPSAYETFSLEYSRRVIHALRGDGTETRVPTILFTKGGGAWLEGMAATGATALGVDWSTDLAAARARVGHTVACKAISIPRCWAQLRRRCATKPHAYSRATDGAPATSSISAMASIDIRRRRTSRCSSMRCMN